MSTETEIIKKEDRVNRRVWFHGLSAAFIGGFATAATTVFSALAFGDGLKRALEMALVNCLMAGAVSAWAYLKQSPLPPLPKDLLTITRTETTETKTTTDSVSVSMDEETKPKEEK